MKIPQELVDRVTVDLWPTTGKLLGLSRSGVYRAAQAGQIPTLKFGARRRVPVSGLLAMLSIEEPAA